jgi:hypothetical protein
MGMAFISKLFKGKRNAEASAVKRSDPRVELATSGQEATLNFRSRAFKTGRSKSLPVQSGLSRKPDLIKSSLTVVAPRVVRRAKSSSPQKQVAQVSRSQARVTWADEVEQRVQGALDEVKPTDVKMLDRVPKTAYPILTNDGKLAEAFILEIYDMDPEDESEVSPVAKQKSAPEVSQSLIRSKESNEFAEVMVVGADSKAVQRPKLCRQNAAVKTETRQQRVKKKDLSELDMAPQAQKSTATTLLKDALERARKSDIPLSIEYAGSRVLTLANQSFLGNKDSENTALRALLTLDPQAQTEQNDLVALLWYVSRYCELVSQSTTESTDWVASNAISNRDALDAKVDAYIENSLTITLDPLALVKT